VPWCAECDRYLTPPSVRRDGTCPACGRPVEPGPRRRDTSAPARDAASVDDDLEPVPWHFKLLLGAFAVYLGYRFLQMVEWIFH
jgi:hypothetical protein